MLDKHPSVPAPPGLSVIEQTIADLHLKLQFEVANALELTNALNQSKERLSKLNDTIDNLQALYGITMFNNVDPSSTGESTTDPSSPSEKTSPRHSVWAKPKNLSWLTLIEDVIKHKDQMLTINEIMDGMGMDEVAKKDYYQTMSGTLAYVRGQGALIGIPVYRATSKGRAFASFLTGLPDFFEDIEQKKLKPYYEDKFMNKIQELGLYLTKE